MGRCLAGWSGRRSIRRWACPSSGHGPRGGWLRSGSGTSGWRGSKAKVKRHYDQLGIGDRTELGVFNGPHTTHGVGTYKFLHKHPDWPEPGASYDIAYFQYFFVT